MSQQLKMNCPTCNYPRLTDLSQHITTVHGINGQEKKCLLAKARFAALFLQPEQPYSQSDSTPGQCGYAVPETSSSPEQRQPPNLTSDENEDELIPCLYGSHISYERVWGTNVNVMDYDIFKLHIFKLHSMLMAGSRGAGKSEFVKHYIMTNPPERIAGFMVDINQTCFVL